LYFAATSGVCLIRSGAAGFPKKLHSQKKPKENNHIRNKTKTKLCANLCER
jgi:hypothetical protein